MFGGLGFKELFLLEGFGFTSFVYFIYLPLGIATHSFKSLKPLEALTLTTPKALSRPWPCNIFTVLPGQMCGSASPDCLG